MKKIKQLLCLLLCLCTVLCMVTVPASAEAYQITKQSFAFEDPVLGQKPLGVEDIWINNTKYVEVESVEWKGELDANGNIKAGVPYFMWVRLKIKDGVDAGFWIQYYNNVTVNDLACIDSSDSIFCFLFVSKTCRKYFEASLDPVAYCVSPVLVEAVHKFCDLCSVAAAEVVKESFKV